MLRIAICDDEPVAGRAIRDMAAACLPGSSIRTYASGVELLAAEVGFDIALLDIQMEGLNGIETARRLREREKDTVIVFITAAKEYVFDAFDVSAFHYLLKPVREDRLREVLERAVRELGGRARQGRITVKTREKCHTLPLGDILYFENDGRKVLIRTGAETLSVYGAMAAFEKQAGPGFFRSHRRFLVNLAYVAEYDRENITLTGGETVYLAKEKYPEFVRQYMRFLRNGGVTYA